MSTCTKHFPLEFYQTKITLLRAANYVAEMLKLFGQASEVKANLRRKLLNARRGLEAPFT
jgi:hypothetical protein